MTESDQLPPSSYCDATNGNSTRVLIDHRGSKGLAFQSKRESGEKRRGAEKSGEERNEADRNDQQAAEGSYLDSFAPTSERNAFFLLNK